MPSPPDVTRATRRFEHTLIVGGTGMLLDASVALGARSNRLTSVARTSRSLAHLDAALRGAGCVHHRLPLDWREADGFVREIEGHLAATSPADLVVAWIHDDELAVRLAERLTSTDRPATFVHVVGSATTSPQVVADAACGSLDPQGAALAYRQVILGAHRWAGGMRWLTHEEISAGVLEAIELDRARFVVGAVLPA